MRYFRCIEGVICWYVAYSTLDIGEKQLTMQFEQKEMMNVNTDRTSESKVEEKSKLQQTKWKRNPSYNLNSCLC